MRKIDSSSITNSVGMPWKAGTFVHLQAAYQEVFDGLTRNLFPHYQANTVYILYGCVNSGSGLSYTISAGAVYYNGEIFLVDAVTFTAAAGQVPVATIGTTYYTDPAADPVQFTDGSNKNVHQIRKVVIAAATSGSGISDYSSFGNSALVLKSSIGSAMPPTLSLTFTRDENTEYTSAPNNCAITLDATGARPGAIRRIKWTFGSSLTLTINTGSGQTVIKDSGDLAAVSGANNILYILYVGKNAAGNDEFSYSLKQV